MTWNRHTSLSRRTFVRAGAGLIAAGSLSHATKGIPTPKGARQESSISSHVSHLPSYQKGVNLLWYANSLNDESFPRLIDRLQSYGVNAVNIVYPIFMDDRHASTVYTDSDETPGWDVMQRPIAMLKERGFLVGLRPSLDERNLTGPDGSNWRGTIDPRNKEGWSASKKDHLLTAGQFAQSSGVDVLYVSVEEESMTEPKHAHFWIDIIDSVRRVFDGAIGESRNWTRRGLMGFEHMVDIVGVDFFAPTSLTSGATPTQVAAALKPELGRLADLSNELGKPVTITEFAFDGDGGHYEMPWIHQADSNPDRQAEYIRNQADYYVGFCQNEPYFRQFTNGLYFWGLGVNDDPDTIPGNLAGFNPINKPSVERAIIDCFNRLD